MEHLEKELLKNDKQIGDLEAIDKTLRLAVFQAVQSDLRSGQIGAITKDISSIRIALNKVMEGLSNEGEAIGELLNLNDGNR